MAIASVGTPVIVRSGTSPVTGTWGTGQTRTAGNLLVAVLSAVGSTSTGATAQNTGTTGWANRLGTGSTPNAISRIAVWTTTAAGTDAAPAFTSALAGGLTGMTCTLFELSGANTTSPVDASGTLSNADTGTTLTPSVSTSGNVSANGGYALGVVGMERTSGTNTWTPTGTGFSNVVNDGASSSAMHIAIDQNTSPGAGAACTESGNWATETTARGAYGVIVFAVPPAASTAGLLMMT